MAKTSESSSNQALSIEAKVRSSTGKGAARKIRAGGAIPGIIYSKGSSLAVELSGKDIVRAVTGPKKRNTLLSLQLKDAAGKDHGKKYVLVKDLQTSVVRREATHVDFQEVSLDLPVAVKIPLEVTGKSKALNDGAKMQVVLREIKVAMKPGDVPEKIIHDVTEMGFGVIRAKSIQLPPGAKLLEHVDAPVVSIRMPRAEKEEATVAAAATTTDAAAAAPADGKPAAPAADAKAAAASADDKKKK